MDIIKSKKRFLINIAALYALLGYGYYFFFYIFQNYSNKIGFELHINYFKLAEGFVIIMLLSLFYVYNDLNESVYLTFTFIFHVFIIVPSASYYFLSNQARAYFYMQVGAILLLNLIYWLNKNLFRSNMERYPNKLFSKSGRNSKGVAMKIFMAIIGLFMIADIIIYIKYGNSVLYLFKLDKVYDIRLKARDAVPGKLKYIISWSAMAIVPASIAWCLKRRKYFLIVVPIIIQILIFTIGGTKSHIFTLALAVFLYLLFSLKKVEWFVPCLNFIVACSLLLKNNFIMAVVVKRAFFFPMSISYNYYDFFTQFPQLNLSQSILKRFFENPYKLDAPFIISRYVYKAPVMSANTNFISNAFANYRFLGIVAFTLIIAVVLVIIERISYNKVGKKYIILITFCSFYALVNSALFTTLMTHGLLFALVLSYIFFRDEEVGDSI